MRYFYFSCLFVGGRYLWTQHSDTHTTEHATTVGTLATSKPPTFVEEKSSLANDNNKNHIVTIHTLSKPYGTIPSVIRRFRRYSSNDRPQKNLVEIQALWLNTMVCHRYLKHTFSNSRPRICQRHNDDRWCWSFNNHEKCVVPSSCPKVWNKSFLY